MTIKQLMDWHFNVQKGMYFDRKISVDSCSIYLSDIIEDGFWNYAFVPSGVDLSEKLELISNQFTSSNRIPCIYTADSGTQQKTADLLTKAGYVPLSEESFMTYTLNSSIKTKPTSLTVKCVTDEKTRVDFEDVFTSAYGGDKTPEQPYGELDESYIRALRQSFSNKQKFYHFVCYDNKIPVSIATLCFLDGKGGLYNVVTVPSYRSKGCGTVATKACIDKWIELKGDTLFLQTETGSFVEKWYYKLGFKLNFTAQTYYKNI